MSLPDASQVSLLEIAKKKKKKRVCLLEQATAICPPQTKSSLLDQKEQTEGLCLLPQTSVDLLWNQKKEHEGFTVQFHPGVLIYSILNLNRM